MQEAGYWALVVTAFALPFEATQRPLLQTRYVTVTNLKVLFYLIVALAALTLIHELNAPPKPLSGSIFAGNRRLSLGLFGALLLSCVVSSYLGHDRLTGLKWTLDVALGGLIWLATPIWLRHETERKVKVIGLALVAGALLAAVAGVLEVSLGAGLTKYFLWFKAKETTIGPYTRLSGTFEYANIAALYFELALPFAVLGFVTGIRPDARASRPSRTPFSWAVAGWLAAIGLLFGALLLTYSRGAWLGLAAAAGAVAFALRGRHLPVNWLLAVGGTLVITGGLVVLWSPALTALRLTSESDQSWYRAAYHASLPSTLRADQQVSVRVTVKNLGPLTWNARGAQPYHLSYHWLHATGRMQDYDEPRTSLSSDLAPGRSETVVALLRAPGQPGHYLLTWDMVQEGVTWFSSKSGTYATWPVRVTGPPAASQTPTGATGPATLPRSLPEPSRRQLWAAALRMIRAHPLFGVGPGAYRLQYGNYARPRQQSWDQRILANSLPLEIFADLGLVGGGLFWAFLAAVLSGLTVIVWRGQQASLTSGIIAPWQIAVIGSVAAFLGHGLVDYILGSDAIFILFWILCGLAATTQAPPLSAGQE